MPDAQRLIRAVLALPELGLRVAWLKSELGQDPSGPVAAALEQVLLRSQAGEGNAREATLALAITWVIERRAAWLRELSEQAESRALLTLSRLLPRTVPPPEAFVEDSVRTPSYAPGRELSVGERRSLARRPTRRDLERLLGDPHPLVLEMLFQCPTLTERDVVSVVTKRPARHSAIDTLCDSPKWLARAGVRLALIQNPGTPLTISLPLLATCLREDLASIVSATPLPGLVRSAAHEIFERLPPVPVDEMVVH